MNNDIRPASLLKPNRERRKMKERRRKEKKAKALAEHIKRRYYATTEK